MNNLDLVLRVNPYNAFDLKDYYTKYINYNMDDNKQIALKRFIKTIQTVNITRRNKFINAVILTLIKYQWQKPW